MGMEYYIALAKLEKELKDAQQTSEKTDVLDKQPPKHELSHDDKRFIQELKRCIAYLEQGRGREIRESQERLRVTIEKRQKAFNEALKEKK